VKRGNRMCVGVVSGSKVQSISGSGLWEAGAPRTFGHRSRGEEIGRWHMIATVSPKKGAWEGNLEDCVWNVSGFRGDKAHQDAQ
jgi:hypothetical protein